MKTIMNKEEFAKFIFAQASDMEHYKYDLFYDIGKLHKSIDYHIAGCNKKSYFILFFRSTGFDMVETTKQYIPVLNHENECLEYRIKNNNLVIRLEINSGDYLTSETIKLEPIKDVCSFKNY